MDTTFRRWYFNLRERPVGRPTRLAGKSRIPSGSPEDGERGRTEIAPGAGAARALCANEAAPAPVVLRPAVGGRQFQPPPARVLIPESRCRSVELFPYPARQHQREIVDLVQRAVRSGAHVVVESGTGTGKTVCALSGALAAAAELGKRVLYLTRTNSQQKLVVSEFRRIRERNPLFAFSAVALQGRRNLCLLAREDDEFADAGPEELAQMCQDRKRGTESKEAFPRDCRFYRAFLGGEGSALAAWARDEVPAAEGIVAESARRGACPYEVTRALLPHAGLAVAPFPYYFHPFLRQSLMHWMHASVQDLVLVIDEAHNLPSYARELLARELSRAAVERALAELGEFGDPEVGGVQASRLLAALAAAIDELAADFAVEEEGPVPPGEMEARLLAPLGMTSPRLDKAIAALGAYGDGVRARKRIQARLPRSHAGGVAAFLEAWRGAEEPEFVKVVAPGKLVLWPLDASLATRQVLEAHASVHMSGTLAPLDAYRDAVGLPHNTPLHRFPSPFPRANRLALYAPGVTTQHDVLQRDPSMLERVVALADALVLGVRRPAAVFFPSHDLLRRGMRLTRVRPLVEEEGMQQTGLMDLVARFKSEGGALFAVSGGRIAEGLDFPAGELELAVVVGMPYPRPSYRLQALIRYDEMRFGRGFEYAVHAPTQRRVLQAAGRLIRGPEDRGVLVILDHRAERLAAAIEGLHASDDPVAEAQEFFAEGR